MIRRLILLWGLTLAVGFPLPSAAQTGAAAKKPAAKASTPSAAPKSTTEKPASKPAKEAESKAKADSKDDGKDDKDKKEGGGEDPLSKMFGEGGMEMTTGEGGTMTMETDPETGDMSIMKVKRNVKIKSEAFNLQCEDLEINNTKNELVATGAPVTFSKEELEGQCAHLYYNTETKKMILKGGGGGDRPWIKQKSKGSGQVTRTSADTITIVQNGNANQVSWEGRPVLTIEKAGGDRKAAATPESGGGATAGGAPADPKKAGEKITPATVNKLRSPQSQQ